MSRKIQFLSVYTVVLSLFLSSSACASEKSEKVTQKSEPKKAVVIEKKVEAPIVIASSKKSSTKKKTAAELEKEKALKNPYPNDFGPDEVDISMYPKNLQEGYKLMVAKCSVCHSPSRPLHSQFVDMSVEEIAKAKKSNPEMFKNKKIWQVEKGIWQRYVKRMMAKPGCNIKNEEGKKIFYFLRADAKRRKTGKNAKKWQEFRSKLVSDFKKSHPHKYKELFKE